MSETAHRQRAADLTASFVSGIRPAAPSRLEAKVSSREGMPLLCAVEAALAGALPRSAQELVWLSGAPPAGRHVLRLRAFGPANELLAEIEHELS